MITNDWRKELKELQENGTALEAIADEFPPEIPWEIRLPYRWLAWVESGERPAAFACRVREVAAVAASIADGKPSIYQHAHGPSPYLIAVWTITRKGKRCTVAVVSSNSSCKVDPRVPYVPEQSPMAHPECAAAIDELKEQVEEMLESCT